MKRLAGKTKFITLVCANCRFSIKQKRKNGYVKHCKVYHTDTPWYGYVMPLWCNNKHEFKGR